jgi:uncharacterized protein (DUF488 family)
MFTIGHSTLPLATFTKILVDNRVAALADIRAVPKSRHNPQFTRESLAKELPKKAIGYGWLPQLGGLRHPVRGPGGLSLLNAGWLNENFRGYADYMQTDEFVAAIDDLLAIGPESATAIMCAEAVPWRCHRSLVSDALTVRDIKVFHILSSPDGASHSRPHQLTKFAQVEGQRVWYPAENSLFNEEDVELKKNILS